MPVLLAICLTATPLPDPDVLEPSIQNEVEHALARVPSCYPDTNQAFAGGQSATERAISLVSTQQADGRWRVGTNDVTFAAVRELEALAGMAPQPVRERTPLLTNGDLNRSWCVWIRGEERDSDTKGVFTAEGDTLHVSGAAMGCVTTRKAYRDYRLTLEFRFVDRPEQLNKTAARDGGVLFHSFGVDGAYCGIWRCSFEYNVIQGASGDLILVGCTNYPGILRARGKVDPASRGRSWQRWNPHGVEVSLVNKGRIRRPDVDPDWKNLKSQPLSPNEKPVGEWNRVEIVCRGDRAEFYFNGLKVGEYWNLNPAGGYIQLQSEGFGIDYRKIVLLPLS